MKKSRIKIGVIGSGPVGNIVATKLSLADWDVEYVYDRHTDIEIGNMRDITIIGDTEPCSALIKCIPTANNFSSKKDIIFLMCKSTHIHQHIQAVKDNLSPRGFVVMLNNTLVRNLVSTHIPKSKIVGMLIEWSCTKTYEGEAVIINNGPTMLGVYSLDAMPLAKLTCNILSCLGECYVLEDFSNFVLGRVILNSTLACLGALTGEKLGDYLKRKYAKKLFVELIKEGYFAYLSIGITPTDYDGKLDYSLFVQDTRHGRRYRRKIINFLIKYNSNTHSSILKDLQDNKSVEIDYLLGKIIETARKCKINCDYSEKVYKKIAQIKANNDTIRPELLELIYKEINKK